MLDENNYLTVNVPDKISQSIDEESKNKGLDIIPTCGWLIEQVEIKYAQLIK